MDLFSRRSRCRQSNCSIILIFFFITCLVIKSTRSHQSYHHHNHQQQPHHHHSHHRSHDYPRSPVELMVDLTNRIGFRILYQHSIGNRNNIAMSPCGLASVLVALYEGSDGPSAIQIHKAMEFPWDRDLIRIGFRDIHRRLRSYFYSQDNLLSGLSLSEANVTVKPEYENILRFYGYDLENGNMITSGSKSACKENTTESTEMKMDDKEEVEGDEEMETTTMIPETTTEIIPPESTTEVTTTTTPKPTTTKKEPMTTTTTTTTTSTTPMTTTTTDPASSGEETTTTRTTNYIFTFKPPKATTELSESEALEASTLTTTIFEGTTSTSEAGTDAPDSSSSADDLNALKRRRRRKNRTFNLSQHRWKRSSSSQLLPIHYLLSNLEEQPLPPSEFAIINGASAIGTPHSQQFSISDYVVQQPSFNLKDTLNETPQHEDVITHLFYLNRQDTINVPFKVFNSIMKYGYYSAIQASVLEVDLDSNNYSLMIILPDWLDSGLESLITTLKSPYSPHLREMRNALQPTWVKAIIPKFYLTGHIVLTADLQNVRAGRNLPGRILVI